MPIYQYSCRICGRNFELLRRFADADTAAPCPDGHDDTARRYANPLPPRNSQIRSRLSSGAYGSFIGGD
ncbi:zinc ribbon domain-containing protein [Streptomyces sp. NPDC020951]|uniref:zinc ribbon domain-containing protein n=1 Tax=Streptomyces sp. NPDC020951 TaxID=3365104 RepID=UPI00379DF6C3